MKTFITVYDVEKLAAVGKREVELSRDVVITPDAIDRAKKLGLVLVVRGFHPHLPGWALAFARPLDSSGKDQPVER